MKTTVVYRLERKIDFISASPCWLWTGAKTEDGYGLAEVAGRTWLVHRLVYTLLVGPIADGLVLDHVRTRGCVHRACCRPEHLEPVTVAENNRRANAVRRAGSVFARRPSGLKPSPERPTTGS